MVDGGFAQTHAVFDGDKVLTDEAVSRVTGVTAGPIRIASLETRIKLDYILDGEPVITYAMTIAGIENEGKPFAGLGAQGITLAGEKVAGRELIDQFNAEVAKNGAALKEKAWADYILLATPVVQKDDDGGVHVTGPAVEVGQVNTTRQGQGGSHFGLRLGYASVYAILNGLEGLVPDAGDLLTSGSGSGSPLEGQFGDDTAASASPGAVPSSTSADASALGASAGLGTASGSGPGSGGYGGGASAGTGVADASATAGADQAAAPPAEEALPLLGGATPQGGGTSAQLAAAESRRAAKNTANGLLGGILLLLGSMVWAVGMAVFGKK
jgi:hypothetical protein